MLKTILAPLFAISTFPVLAKEATTVQTLMHEKLSHTQRILEGLTKNDFKLITESATFLKDLSKAASWHKIEDTDFQRFAQSFQDASEELYMKAKDRNAEAVALGYMRLTFTCLHCHQRVRDQKIQNP